MPLAQIGPRADPLAPLPGRVREAVGEMNEDCYSFGDEPVAIAQRRYLAHLINLQIVKLSRCSPTAPPPRDSRFEG
jgi:hypothetical protein